MELPSERISALLRKHYKNRSTLSLELERMKHYKQGIKGYHKQLLRYYLSELPLPYNERGILFDANATKYQDVEIDGRTYSANRFVNRSYLSLSEVNKNLSGSKKRWSSVGFTHDLREVISEDIIEILRFKLSSDTLIQNTAREDIENRDNAFKEILTSLKDIFILLQGTVLTDQANPIRSALILENVFMRVLQAIHSRRIDADSVVLNMLREDVSGYKNDLGQIAKDLLERLPQSGREGARRVYLVMEIGYPSTIELAYDSRNVNFLSDSLVETWISEMYRGSLYDRMSSLYSGFQPAPRDPEDISPEGNFFRTFQSADFDPFVCPSFGPIIQSLEEWLIVYSAQIFARSGNHTEEPSRYRDSFSGKERLNFYLIDFRYYMAQLFSPARYLKSPAARSVIEFCAHLFHLIAVFLALFVNRSKTTGWVSTLAIFAIAHALNQVELMVVEYKAASVKRIQTGSKVHKQTFPSILLDHMMRFEGYFLNPWNIIDATAMGVSLGYFILWFLGNSFSARAVLAFNCILLSVKLLHSFTAVRSFGLVVVSLLRISGQVFAFLVVWLILTVGFAGAFYGHFRDEEESYGTWRETFVTLILAALGDFDYPFENSYWGPLLLTIYIVFSGISLLSCLIAVMTEVFETIQDNEAKEFSLLFANEVVRLKWNEESSFGVLPAPLNIFPVMLIPMKFVIEAFGGGGESGRKTELVGFLLGFKVILFLPICFFILGITTLDFIKVYIPHVLLGDFFLKSTNFAWASVTDLFFINFDSVENTEQQDCRKMLKLFVRYSLRLFISPLILCVTFMYLVLAPVLIFVILTPVRLVEIGITFIESMMDFKGNFEEFSDEINNEVINPHQEDHEGIMKATKINWFFSLETIKEVKETVARQSTKRKVESLKFSQLFGASQTTFTLDEWINVTSETDEMNHRRRRPLLDENGQGLLQDLLARNLTGSIKSRIFSGNSFSIHVEDIADISKMLQEIEKIPMTLKGREGVDTAEKDSSKYFYLKVIEQEAKFVANLLESPQKRNQQLGAILQRLFKYLNSLRRRIAHKMVPEKSISFKNRVSGLCEHFGIPLEKSPKGVPPRPRAFESVAANDVPVLVPTKVQSENGELVSTISQAKRLLSREYDSHTKRKFLLEVFGENVANQKDLFETIMEGSTSCKGDVLLVELTILLEKSYGNQVKLIEDQLKKISAPFTQRKLDRASIVSKTMPLHVSTNRSGWKKPCCLPSRTRNATLGTGETEHITQSNYGSNNNIFNERHDSAKQTSVEVQERDDSWETLLAMRIFRLIFYSVSMTPDYNPFRFINIVHLAISNVKRQFKGFPQAQDKMDGLLDRIQGVLIKGTSLQTRMIETIDEAHLFRMLTAGIPSALDIALEARNLPFLSHPSVSSVAHKMFVGNIFHGMKDTGSWVAKNLEEYIGLSSGWYSLGDTGCTYKYVAAKTNLKIYNRPLRSEKIGSVRGRDEANKSIITTYYPSEEDNMFIKGAVCAVYQEGSVRVDEKQLDLREKLEEALKFGPVEVVAQFRIPKGKEQTWTRKYYSARVQKRCHSEADGDSYQLVYTTFPPMKNSEGRTITETCDSSILLKDYTILKSVPAEHIRLKNDIPLLRKGSFRYYELVDGRGWVMLPELDREEPHNNSTKLLTYKASEELKIFNRIQKECKDGYDFVEKENLLLQGEACIIIFRDGFTDYEGGFEHYELADGRGWIRNMLPTDDTKIGWFRRKIRQIVCFNALRIPREVLTRPHSLSNVGTKTFQTLIAYLQHAMKRNDGLVDSETLNAFAKLLRLELIQVQHALKWLKQISYGYEKYNGSSYHLGQETLLQNCLSTMKEIWYCISHTWLVREWYALSQLVIEPQRFLRSPLMRYMLEFAFFSSLIGCHFAAIDIWNDGSDTSSSYTEIISFHPTEGVLFVFVLGYIIQTYRQYVDTHVIMTFGQRLDYPICVAYIIAYSMRFQGLTLTEKSDERITRLALRVLSFNSVLLSMKIIYILGLSKRIGPMIEAFLKLMKAICVFILLLAMLIVGFGGWFSAWYGNCGEHIGYCMVTDDDSESKPFASLSETFIKLVQATLGDFGISGMNRAGEDDDFVNCFDAKSCRNSFRVLLPKVIGPCMFILYALISTVTLLNLLVAVICKLYANEQENANVAFILNKISHTIRLKWQKSLHTPSGQKRMAYCRTLDRNNGNDESILELANSQGDSTLVEEETSGADERWDPLGILALDALPAPLNLFGLLILVPLSFVSRLNSALISEKFAVTFSNQVQFVIYNISMTLLLDSLLVVLTAAAITLLLGVAIVFVTVTMFFAVFASGQEPWGFTKGDPRSIFWVVPEIYFPEPGFSVGRYIRGDISEQEDSKLRYICKGREVTDQKGCPLHQNKKSWHHILRLWNILVTHRGNLLIAFLLLIQTILAPVLAFFSGVILVTLIMAAIIVTILPVVIISIPSLFFAIRNNLKKESESHILDDLDSDAQLLKPIERMYEYLQYEYAVLFMDP